MVGPTRQRVDRWARAAPLSYCPIESGGLAARKSASIFSALCYRAQFNSRPRSTLLTGPFRFVVVGAASYLTKHGTPQRPEELLQHECITFRLTTGALYGWELERGRRAWRVPVRGGVVTNESRLRISLAEDGLGLAYVMEPIVEEQLRKGRLRVVLELYAATVPGFFLYFPSRAQSSPALRLFIEAAKEMAANTASA